MEKQLHINDFDEEEDFQISDVIHKYLPFWPLFLALIIAGFAASYIYLRYKIPVYEISANILIKDEKKGIDESTILESLDLFGSKKIVENEIEILKSRSLMKQVVNNLQLYAPIFEEGLIKDASAYKASPVKVEAKHPDAITTSIEKIHFVFDSVHNTATINKNIYPVNQWFAYEEDTLRFIANVNYSPKSEKRQMYFSLVDLKKAASDLLANVNISSVNKQATVITLILNDEVPVRGENILNELIKVYNRAAIEDKNVLAGNTLAFVEERLRGVTEDLGRVEGNIEKFKTSQGIVDISSQGQIFLQSVETNDQKIAEMSMQLAVLNQVEKYVVSKNGNAGIVPGTLGVTDPLLNQLLETLYNLQLQYERLRKTIPENNPVALSLQDQIEKVKPNILENIRSQKNALDAGMRNLNVNSNRYSSMLRTIPEKERQLLDISRQQSIKNSIYTFLLQKREETALSFASAVADSRIVDVAEASILPVSPKKMLVYLISLVAAIVIAVSVVIIKELLNQNILFRNEIEKYVSWPIIGEVSFDPSENKIVINEKERTIISEQFRQIRTSLDYLGIDANKKKILFTSSISGEGKSFVATNMAISLALTNKKVVLIELDLRKPKLSPLFNVKPGDIGLTNYLIGKAGIDEVTRETVIHENLFFIASGPIPPNPSELILNRKIPELLEYLEKEYDYILIDTAPVAPVTDAQILSKFCDASLYIIRHGYTPKVFIKRLEQHNKITGLKNPAIIFNGLKDRGFGKYGYGYGYGYGYAYSE